jgi:hypothetical protein
MSRYIDADVLIDDLIHNRSFYPALVAGAIKNTPTADVVEVVRCEDCKHAYINSFSAQSGVALCRFWTNRAEGVQVVMQQDDFCSYGERKENGTH